MNNEEVTTNEEVTAGKPTVYEVVSKVTGEKYLATGMTFGEGEVIASTELGDIVFANPNKDGNLTNEDYEIHEVLDSPNV